MLSECIHFAGEYMDWLKELLEAHNQRIKTPIIGSIILAFIAWNWQAIFYVLFANAPVEDRFQYWERVTSDSTLIFIPITLGTAFAISIPFISFISAAIVKTPINELRKLNQKSAHELALERVAQQQDLEKWKEDLIASALKQQEDLDKLEGDAKLELEKRLNNLPLASEVRMPDLTKNNPVLDDLKELELQAEYVNLFRHVTENKMDTKNKLNGGLGKNDEILFKLVDELFSVDNGLDPFEIRKELLKCRERIKNIGIRLITLNEDSSKQHVINRLKEEGYSSIKRLRDLIAGLPFRDYVD